MLDNISQSGVKNDKAESVINKLTGTSSKRFDALGEMAKAKKWELHASCDANGRGDTQYTCNIWKLPDESMVFQACITYPNEESDEGSEDSEDSQFESYEVGVTDSDLSNIPDECLEYIS